MRTLLIFILICLFSSLFAQTSINVNGRRIEHWNGRTIQKCFSDLRGIYILQVKDGQNLHRQKVCLL